jgi:hypothetical protein
VLKLLPQQTETSKRRAARNKHGNHEIEETSDCILPGKRAMLGRCGSAAPRSALG